MGKWVKENAENENLHRFLIFGVNILVDSKNIYALGIHFGRLAISAHCKHVQIVKFII